VQSCPLSDPLVESVQRVDRDVACLGCGLFHISASWKKAVLVRDPVEATAEWGTLSCDRHRGQLLELIPVPRRVAWPQGLAGREQEGQH
jgi:hypothetical protein